MKRWRVLLQCSVAVCPLFATGEVMAERPVAPESEKQQIDMVQLARQLQQAVDRGEITQEEMEDRLFKAAMGQVEEVAPIVPAWRRARERRFDPEVQQQQFEAWIETIVAQPELGYAHVLEYTMLYETQQLNALMDQKPTVPSVGVMLAQSIQNDRRLLRDRAARACAVAALSAAELHEQDLRDPAVREILLGQLKIGGENADAIIRGSLWNIPKEQAGLWYPPLAELLRSGDARRVIRACNAIEQLRLLAEADAEYLRGLIADLRSASPDLFQDTYVSPYDRLGVAYERWPRSRVRAAATAALLNSSPNPPETLAFLATVEGSARLDVASGIAAAFCGYRGFNTEAWQSQQVNEAFELLDRILADPGAKVIVVDPQADVWADYEYRRYGNSILSVLCHTAGDYGNAAVASQALSSAMRAARAHGDPDLSWSVYFFVRDHDPAVLELLTRETSTIDIGAEMVMLARQLREAVERGDMTEARMQQILEQEAERQFNVP